MKSTKVSETVRLHEATGYSNLGYRKNKKKTKKTIFLLISYIHNTVEYIAMLEKY